MTKLRILSGIQPTGKLHLGNYLGALKNFTELQNSGKYECFFMIADYHSITEDYEPKEKPRQILELALDYLAVGLDSKKSVIFLQSLVPEHTELTWIFNTITPVTELFRMTQYKDKAEQQKNNINAGLLDYPVLMAADILIYKSPVIPVGDDQTQHVELTRDIARRFNRRFGQTFPEPKALHTPASRLKSLLDPAKKMSKSYGDEHCIYLTDEPDTILSKLKQAVTDTRPAGKEKSPGVANLFLLLENFGRPEDLKKFEAAHKTGAIRYAELKEMLAQRIAEYFAAFREKRTQLAGNLEAVKKILVSGSKQAQRVARHTLQEVKQKIGLSL